MDLMLNKKLLLVVASSITTVIYFCCQISQSKYIHTSINLLHEISFGMHVVHFIRVF